MSTPARVITLYKANPTASTNDVARLLDMSPSTVRLWLTTFDVPLRSWSELSKNRRDKHAEEVVNLYSQYIGPRRIAKRLQIGENLVVAILNDRNLRRSPSEARSLWRQKQYDAKRKMALHMLQEGMIGTEVARELGLHKNTIYKWGKLLKSDASWSKPSQSAKNAEAKAN